MHYNCIAVTQPCNPLIPMTRVLLRCPVATKHQETVSRSRQKRPSVTVTDDAVCASDLSHTHTHISLVRNGVLVEDSGTFSIHQLADPPPLSHLLVLTAAHCFEFITVNRLLYSHLPPSLCSPSVVPVLSPGKGQSHLQSYSLPERQRTRVSKREGGGNRHARQCHYRQILRLWW